ncbi:unnamed protein product, partial [Closterium sp. NIES-53]
GGDNIGACADSSHHSGVTFSSSRSLSHSPSPSPSPSPFPAPSPTLSPPRSPSPPLLPSPSFSPSLSNSIMGLLRGAFEAAHRDMHVTGEPLIGQPRVVDRCKLTVKLGKIQIKPPRGSQGVPPFTAGALESHLNQQGKQLPLRVKSPYEKGLSKAVFDAVESGALEEGTRGPHTKTFFHLRVKDNEADMTYKLICAPHPDGTRLILTKVKCHSTRYALIDVARPVNAVDFRFFLRKESRICSLDVRRRGEGGVMGLPQEQHRHLPAQLGRDHEVLQSVGSWTVNPSAAH